METFKNLIPKLNKKHYVKKMLQIKPSQFTKTTDIACQLQLCSITTQAKQSLPLDTFQSCPSNLNATLFLTLTKMQIQSLKNLKHLIK